MSITRRKTLAILGGGAILAASGATGAFITTRTPTKALAPWTTAGGYGDPRRKALSYAILAPNPHNRQPWLIDLKTPDQVILHREKARDLPHTDPYARQLTIGLGCFLELMRMAAAEDGFAVDFSLFPDGDNGPVAIATFKPGGAPDPLFAQALKRRSCKEPYEARGPGEIKRAALASFANIIADASQVGDIKALTWEAWQTEANTARTMKESVDLMRFGKAEINADPDGISLGGPFLETLMLTGILSRKAQLDPNSSGFKEGVRIYNEMLNATPAYAVLTTNGNSRLDQISAGRRWLRLNLKTTELGLALHPVSQALQEYSEMAPYYARTHEMLAEPGDTVQMLGRLGYGPTVSRSPRWPLETRILT
jgi:hypothetical protein